MPILPVILEHPAKMLQPHLLPARQPPGQTQNARPTQHLAIHRLPDTGCSQDVLLAGWSSSTERLTPVGRGWRLPGVTLYDWLCLLYDCGWRGWVPAVSWLGCGLGGTDTNTSILHLKCYIWNYFWNNQTLNFVIEFTFPYPQTTKHSCSHQTLLFVYECRFPKSLTI